MHDLGDTVSLAAKCRDAAGAPASATTATLTVTLPDGTTVTPAVTNPPATAGAYTTAYVTTQAGRHTYRYTFTGIVPDQAYSDIFHVWPAAVPWIVGLTDTKDALNIAQTNTTHDDELRRAIAGASAVVEDIVGAVAVRSFTESYPGGDSAILLIHRPVLAIASVTDNGNVVDATSYTVNAAGVLARATSGVPGRWPAGVDNIAVTYTAGRRVVTDNILEGTRDLIRVNFRPQLGGSYSPFDAGGQQPEQGGQVRLGFFVPNSVMQKLNASGLGPMVG